jgi:hypothetical protein
LILAHFQVQAVPSSEDPDRKRKASDELFSDLEMELGEALVQFAEVRMNYSHTVFPRLSGSTARHGVTASATTLETVVTAAFKHRNPASAWSPCPSPQPASNHLFGIIASHWGPSRAAQIGRQISQPRSALSKPPSKVRYDALRKSADGPSSCNQGLQLAIPRRQASLSSEASSRSWTAMAPSPDFSTPPRPPSMRRRIPASSTASSLPSPQRSGAKTRPSQSGNASWGSIPNCKRQLVGADSLRCVLPEALGPGLDGASLQMTTPIAGSSVAHLKSRNDERWYKGQWR